MNTALKKFVDLGMRHSGLTADPAAQPADGVVIHLHPVAEVNKTIRAGIVAILVVFGGLGAWAMFAPLSGAVIGTGVIKLDTNRKVVQHLEGGIIKDIRVRNGDYVRVGQTLIVLDDANVLAGVDILKRQLDGLVIRMSRLEAERSELTDLSFPQEIVARLDEPEVARMVQVESDYFKSSRRTLLGQEELLQQQAAEAENELEGLNDQVTAARAALDLIKQEVAATSELEKQKYVQKFELLRLQRSVEDYRIRLGEYVSEVSMTRQKIIDLNLRIADLRNRYMTTAAQQLTEVSATIYSVLERLRPSLDAKLRQNIVAPISGTVVDMQVFTIGGVVTPRERLLDIVQDDGILIVETQLGVDSIDSVKVGQQAEVRLSAYSSRNTPLILGAVSYVSADRLTDERNGMPYYLAHIELDRASLDEAGNQVELYPGMSAEVFIKTGERTAVDYLLSPVTDSLRRSAREP